MADRRRVVGPTEGTTAPVFASSPALAKPSRRERGPQDLRKVFLKTSLTPPATGSAFLELPSPPSPNSFSTLKLSCSVYGPRPLPPSAPFSAQARLSCELKFAPFASPNKRRGYVRDHTERDLSVQLATALQRSILLEKYPKAGIDVFITVLDCEGEAGAISGVSSFLGGGGGGSGGAGVDVGLLGVLAGAITCASAAIADAGIECVDLVTGGVSALVRKRGLVSIGDNSTASQELIVVQDPSPEEHDPNDVIAAYVVGYMAAREELTEIWMRGAVDVSLDDDSAESDLDRLMDGAIMAATETRRVLNEGVAERLLYALNVNANAKSQDEMEMT
ncbi:3' exoribonuclease family, domain 1-domain-containing protein [Peziza echinospora]|nr:3' exoribonuclease family, domain 1-domain-containing protein [Peziza echinospora]